MNLSTLKQFSTFLNATPKKLRSIKRIGDNLFRLDINAEIFYFDLTKSKSTIYITDELLISPKIYNAPFDKSLQKLCYNAQIKDSKIDGDNRILQLFLETQNSYKTNQVILQAEFTGCYTNLILLTTNFIVLDALRHITQEQSFREVKIGKPLLPLPQPAKKPLLKEQGDLFEILKANFLDLKTKTLQQKIIKSSTQINHKIKQLQHFLESLEDKKVLETNAKQESLFGKLILQNLYLHPNFKGKEITLENTTITLPSKATSLSHAAQIFFENSKKLSKKAQNIHLQEENLQERIAFYTSLLKMVQNVTNLNDLQILDSHSQKENKNKTSKSFENFFIEGFKVSIGKNQRENIALLKEAKADDIWMHIRNIPSSHLIIHCGKNKIPEIILQKAAKILVGFLKSFNGNYEVDYTKRKFVKITQGANVTYAKEQTLQIAKN